MAPSPFRHRKAARNLALAEAALALARDRTRGSRRSRRPSAKLLLIGGAVAAAGAAALFKRDKVAGLLPSRTGKPASPPAPPPPQPSNYDMPGPVANTATPVPAPDSREEPPPAIDEAAEEADAATEARAIGVSTTAYAGPERESADQAFRPLAETGEGESEGEEQAEAELADNATYRDAGMTDAERQIDDTIEEAGQPLKGEQPAPLTSADAGPGDAGERAREPDGTQSSLLPTEPAGGTAGEAETPGTPPTGSPAPGAGAASEPASGDEAPAADTGSGSEEDAPAADAPDTPGTPPTQPSEESGESGDDWRTWSGRSVNP